MLERLDFYINKGWEVDEMKQAPATVKVNTLSERSGKKEAGIDIMLSRVSNLKRISNGTN